MNKRTMPPSSSSSSRIKLALRRASIRVLSSAELTSIGAGTISKVNDSPTGCAEMMDPM